MDVAAEQAKVRGNEPKQFAVEIDAAALGISGDAEAQLAHFTAERESVRALLRDSGSVVLRGLELSKNPEGFQRLYEALGFEPCLDPLHAVSARPTADGSKSSPVYEAVNKESRKNFYIGMHNEFVGKRAPRAAAFVCFKAAEEGGEFLLCDGRAMFRDVKPELLSKMYDRSIRYSVMELPFFGFLDGLPEEAELGPLKLSPRGTAMGAIRGLAKAAINAKVDFDVDLQWGEGGYDKVRMLQARAPAQPPAVRHPETGEPVWFCNVHSHSAVLRKQREAVYGEEVFSDGASQINKSDMYFGDDGDFTAEELAHLDEVTTANIKMVKMQPGDVVLLDNYMTMHGRNVFEGTRKHCVAWFK